MGKQEIIKIIRKKSPPPLKASILRFTHDHPENVHPRRIGNHYDSTGVSERLICVKEETWQI